MHTRPSTLAVDVRSGAVESLTPPVVAAIELNAWVRHAQRNLSRPAVAEIGAPLENLAAAVEGHSDKIAAHTRTNQYICDPSFLRCDQFGSSVAEADFAVLIEAFTSFGDALRKASNEATVSGDAATAEAFIGISRGIDYELCALEAHLADQRQRQRRRLSISALHPLAMRSEHLSLQKAATSKE
jgi:hypothetical protein